MLLKAGSAALTGTCAVCPKEQEGWLERAGGEEGERRGRGAVRAKEGQMMEAPLGTRFYSK